MKSTLHGLCALIACGFVTLAAAQAPDDGTVLEKDLSLIHI